MVEATVTLPVFILSVVALALIISIISVCEEVSFATALETRDIDMQVYEKINSISLCSRIENRVSKECERDPDFRIKKAKYLYRENDISDLIGSTSETNFAVVNAIGIDGRIQFEEKLLTRAFTGKVQDSSPLSESAFSDDSKSSKVVVFPRYGVRYHAATCRYVVRDDVKEEYMAEMEMEDARRKGYTPCKVCGGG